jgi:hypothetical protein
LTTFNFDLASNFIFVYRTLRMRQKTKNYQNQESTDKKIKFFPQSLGHLPRWVHLVQKTRAKNSHAWAPLRAQGFGNWQKKFFNFINGLRKFLAKTGKCIFLV